MAVKELIKRVVNEHQGIKAPELVVLVVQQCAEFPFDHESYDEALTELIAEGEIVEVEYTLPSMDYRVKSIYLPKDTLVEVTRKAS